MEFHLESSHRDLETAIHCIVAALGADRGVIVKETQLQLQSLAARALEFRLTCKVRAAIVSTTLFVRGRAVIGDDLCARFEDLAIDGEGMIAGLAKSALEPRLEALRARAFRIADLQIPGLAVSDVKLSVGETVRLTVLLAGRGE